MVARRFMLLAIGAAVAVAAPATAQRGPVLTPEQAAVILWQAKTADEKCNTLNGPDHDALINLAANAEIAAARSAGTEAATAALAEGRKRGTAMACGEETSAFVQDVFASAGSAYAAAQTANAAPEPATRPGFSLFSRAPREPAAPAVPLPEVKPGDVLGRFKVNTAAYYVELRCRHLGNTRAHRFYQAIVENQREAVGLKGRKAVSKARSEAEALAREQGACSYATAKLVRARYSDAISN